MNKYLSIAIFAVFLFGSGFVYQEFYRPAQVGGIAPSGNIVEVDMRVLRDQWTFEPGILRVDPGDKVVLNIFNEDSYDHGFAIDVFGVNRRLFPQRETVVEFVASLRGQFSFYCSVPCGDGHYDQIGKIFVGEESSSQTTGFGANHIARSCSNNLAIDRY
jgi:cytochrome c oxidase subunit II